MKMSRFIAGLLFPALLLGLVVLFEPAEAQAEKVYYLHNNTRYKIHVALLVPGKSGQWFVDGWQNIAPNSYKRVKLNYAHPTGTRFGVYAYASNAPRDAVWAGGSNAPTITVISQGFQYDRRYSAPGGTNRRNVKVRMVQGNSYKFVYNSSGYRPQPADQYLAGPRWW